MDCSISFRTKRQLALHEQFNDYILIIKNSLPILDQVYLSSTMIYMTKGKLDPITFAHINYQRLICKWRCIFYFLKLCQINKINSKYFREMVINYSHEININHLMQIVCSLKSIKN